MSIFIEFTALSDNNQDGCRNGDRNGDGPPDVYQATSVSDEQQAYAGLVNLNIADDDAGDGDPVPHIADDVGVIGEHLINRFVGTESKEQIETYLKTKRIAAITASQLEHLGPKLDSSCQDWRSFGIRIVEATLKPKYSHDQYKTLLSRIDHCRICYHGGGSPAENLLEMLSTDKPQLTVGDFAQVANDTKRKDIILLLENSGLLNKRDELFEDTIVEAIREKIVIKLDKDVRNNWQSFTWRLGLNDENINVIKLARKKDGVYSPTAKLFELLKSEAPDLTLYGITCALSSIGRNDLVLYLEQEVRESNI